MAPGPTEGPYRREPGVDTALHTPVPTTVTEGSRLKVLVADDEDDIRTLITLAVGKAGATVVAAVCDGPAALAAAHEHRPDLAVLDVSMPGATGLEVCRQLRADPVTSRIAILLLSAGASLDDVACGLAAGADAYLAKPFQVAALVHQVRALTAGRPA